MAKKKSAHQPFTILTTPTLVNKKDVYPNKGILITKADDCFYVYKLTSALAVSKILGIISMGVGLFALKYEHTSFWEYLFTYSLVIIGSFFVIFGFTAKKENKMLILDRLNGKISYPDYFYLPPLHGDFNKIKAVISISGDIDGAIGREYLKFVNVFKNRKFDLLRTISYDDPYEEWSLYVWYMDKNRPLPPGTAFDAYRDKDFERRKKLGFPRPLYTSNIATPEATPAQQKERKLVGGW